MDLYRSENKWIAGVCAGIAESFQIPVWVVRVCWVLGLFVVIPFILYFIFIFTLPLKNNLESYNKPKILGVCFDLAKISGVNLVFIRSAAALLALMSLGVVVLIYIALRILIRN